MALKQIFSADMTREEGDLYERVLVYVNPADADSAPLVRWKAQCKCCDEAWDSSPEPLFDTAGLIDSVAEVSTAAARRLERALAKHGKA